MAKRMTDLAKERAEIQKQFDGYRAETGVNLVRLQEDAVAAQHSTHHSRLMRN